MKHKVLYIVTPFFQFKKSKAKAFTHQKKAWNLHLKQKRGQPSVFLLTFFDFAVCFRREMSQNVGTTVLWTLCFCFTGLTVQPGELPQPHWMREPQQRPEPVQRLHVSGQLQKWWLKQLGVSSVCDCVCVLHREHANGVRVGLHSSNVLLRSCTIRNTETVIGIVVYAGKNAEFLQFHVWRTRGERLFWKSDLGSPFFFWKFRTLKTFYWRRERMKCCFKKPVDVL